jgi:hypothetical protein
MAAMARLREHHRPHLTPRRGDRAQHADVARLPSTFT